jgi:hypothetical protein
MLYKTYLFKFVSRKQYLLVQICGYVRTISGRKRRFYVLNETAYREANNSIIQGTSADIVKKAMIDIYETSLGELMRKVNVLNDSVAWVESNSPQLRSKIVKEWIQQDQLKGEGVDSEGQIIGLYSFYTELLSNGRKKAGDPFDLDDTGAFYRSMFVRVLADRIIIDGDSGKMDNQYWWDDNILNLTDENLQKYIDEIKDNYTSYARRILGLSK